MSELQKFLPQLAQIPYNWAHTIRQRRISADEGTRRTAIESLAALGLAAAVVQFVDFTTRLLSDAKESYLSGKGASEDNLQLKQICEQLKRLSGELTADENAPVVGRESGLTAGRSGIHLVATKDALGLNELASSCKKDCDSLLEILQMLSVKCSVQEEG